MRENLKQRRVQPVSGRGRIKTLESLLFIITNNCPTRVGDLQHRLDPICITLAQYQQVAASPLILLLIVEGWGLPCASLFPHSTSW